MSAGVRTLRRFGIGIAFVAVALTVGAPRIGTAADAAGGFIGKGQIVIASVVAGAKVTLGGDIALEQRGTNFRLDVLSLGFPGADPATSALLGAQLIPPGGFTIVSHGSLEYTIWSGASHKYYTGTPGAPSPAPASTATAPPTTAASGIPFFKSLKDLQALSITIALAGHATTNGHPTTGLAYQFTRVEKNGDPTDVHGRIEIADDLDGMPVEFTASARGKTIPESALKIDLKSFSKQTPAVGDFDVPAGFERAASVGDVLRRSVAGTFGQ